MSHLLRDRIGNPETAHRVATPEAYLEWVRVAHVALGGKAADVAPSGLTLPAYVSDGRWVVQCPCGNCPSAHPEWRVAACVECGAVHGVAVPANWRRGEAALVARPHLRWRTWFPTRELAEAHGRAKPDTIASLERGDTAHDSWTAPRSWTTGELVSASMLNTHVRDNLLETASAKVTAAGDLVVGIGANAIARLAKGSDGLLLGVSGGAVGWVAPPSSSPTGSAGGALAGTYPNPSLATLAQHLLFVDNTYDIGASGATRPRSIYLTTALAIGTNPATTGAVRLVNGAAIVSRNAANSADSSLVWVDATDIIQIGSSAAGAVRITTGFSGLHWNSNALFPVQDNTQALGGNAALLGGNQRWTAVYAVNGTIQTSSRDAKNLRGRVDPAAALAAVRATPLYAFTYKGDDPDLADRPQVGFLAEEADPLLCPDGATASPNTTASVALAAIQALAAEVADLKAQLAAALAGLTAARAPAQEGA